MSFTRYHIGSYDKNCAFFLGNKFFASKIYGSYFYVLCRAGTVIFNKMFYSIIKCKLEWAEKKKKKDEKDRNGRERERERKTMQVEMDYCFWVCSLEKRIKTTKVEADLYVTVFVPT